MAEPALFTRREARPRPPVEIEVGKRSAWLRGSGIVAVLDLVESPRQWCPFRHCYTVPIAYVDDLLVVLEHAQRRAVILTAVDR